MVAVFRQKKNLEKKHSTKLKLYNVEYLYIYLNFINLKIYNQRLVFIFYYSNFEKSYIAVSTRF